MADIEPVIVPGANPANMHLYEIPALLLDEHDNWLRPAYPRYDDELAPAKPFLVPSFDNDVVEILPSTKQDRKINFDEAVYILEIENRFQMMSEEDQVDEEDEVSYEIEIVEGGQTDDADFYLEMIDGEIFYVFETEDDISVEEEEDSDDDSEESSENDDDQAAKVPMQLDIGGMMAPNLDESIRSFGDDNNAHNQFDDDTSDRDTTDRQEDKSERLGDDIEETRPIVEAGMESKDQSHSSDSNGPSSPIAQIMDEYYNMELDLNQIILEQRNKKLQDQQPLDHMKQLLQTRLLDKGNESQSNLLQNSSSINTTFSSPHTEYDDSEIVSPTPSMKKSILKACPPSPKIESPRKSKKERKAKKDQKKTFSKTYVRADDFDGEHRVFAWEKPAWAANNKLRNTGIGDGIRKGVSLAKPITDTKKLLKDEKLKWVKPDWAQDNDEEEKEVDGENNPVDGGGENPAVDGVDAREELIRRIQSSGMNLPTKNKAGRRLKITLNGSSLREGSDIVKPITKATVIKKSSSGVNTLANPKILRATPGGSTIKEGISLEQPTTQATNLKKYAFERPSWTNVKLNSTQSGDILKKGGDVVMPITAATTDKNNFNEPAWKTKRGLGRQASAALVLEGRKDIGWEKPSWALGTKLRKTPLGDDVRAGKADLSKPITNLPHMKHLLQSTSSHSETQLQEIESTGSSDSNPFLENHRQSLRRTSVRRSINEQSKLDIGNDFGDDEDDNASKAKSEDLDTWKRRPSVPRTKSMD